MRAVLQRVSQASVVVDKRVTGQIERGLVVLVGITHDDTDAKAQWLAEKVWRARIFADEKSAADLQASILVVSQFTLYGDMRKGRRPSWGMAAPAHLAEPRYERFCSALTDLGARVERGVFGADMQVQLTNDGPVTLIVEC